SAHTRAKSSTRILSAGVMSWLPGTAAALGAARIALTTPTAERGGSSHPPNRASRRMQAAPLFASNARSSISPCLESGFRASFDRDHDVGAAVHRIVVLVISRRERFPDGSNGGRNLGLRTDVIQL